MQKRDVLEQNLLIKCDFSVIWLIEFCIHAPVSLNLLNSLGKPDKMLGKALYLIVFPQLV